MIVTMSRQDMQGMVEYAKNRIIERMVTKYDVQNAVNSARNEVLSDLQEIRRENQPVFKQTLALTGEALRRVQVVDARVAGIEQDIKLLTQLMSRMVGQQNRTANTLQRY